MASKKPMCFEKYGEFKSCATCRHAIVCMVLQENKEALPKQEEAEE